MQTKITEIKYSRTYAPAPYESETFSMTGSLDEGTSPELILKEFDTIKAMVHASYITNAKVDQAFTNDTMEAVLANPPEKKKRGRKPKAMAAVEAAEPKLTPPEPEEEEVVIDDTELPADELPDSDDVNPEEVESDDDIVVDTEDDKADEDDDEDTIVVPEPEVVVKEPAKKAAPTKKFKTKSTPYSRNNDMHKKLLSGKLTSLFPKWKKSDETIAKAKKLSQAMDGTDFLDADGEIVPSFIISVKRHMTGAQA